MCSLQAEGALSRRRPIRVGETRVRGHEDHGAAPERHGRAPRGARRDTRAPDAGGTPARLTSDVDPTCACLCVGSDVAVAAVCDVSVACAAVCLEFSPLERRCGHVYTVKDSPTK